MLRAIAAACVLALFVHATGGPKQLHLALGGRGSVGMAVSWVSDVEGASIVKYGTKKEALDQEESAEELAKPYKFCNYTSGFQHHVLLPSLSPDTEYFYKAGGEYGWSDVRRFKTPPKRGNLTAPLTFGILGDMGQTNYSVDVLNRIQSYPSLDAVLLAGDLSYADTVQTRWDSWGELVEPSTSRIPWMMAAGNHEIELSCDSTNFDAYQARFRMPHKESGGEHGNLYYSFDVGSVHVVVLTPYIPTYPDSPQYRWLEADLEAIDREATPWIVVMMHGPWYSSNKAHQKKHEPQHAMREQMETLLFDHRVHLVLAGHVHSYERTFPVYLNQRTVSAPIYVTIGDAGNREGLADKYIHPQPIWSAYRKARYGYGLLHVQNHTHALFEWLESDNSNAYDSVWIHSHANKHHHHRHSN